jgi:hypothetical protein
MSYISVDQDGTESLFLNIPTRYYYPSNQQGYWYIDREPYLDLSEGDIETLIGKKLTWEDEPVEI